MNHKLEVSLFMCIIGPIILSLVLFFMLLTMIKNTRTTVMYNAMIIKQNSSDIRKNYLFLRRNSQMLATNTSLLRKLKESSK